jgi:hypothetical protein
MLKRFQANLIGRDATRVKVVSWKNSLHEICDILESNPNGVLERNEMVIAKEYRMSGTRAYAIVDHDTVFGMTRSVNNASYYEVTVPGEACCMFFDCDMKMSETMETVELISDYVESICSLLIKVLSLDVESTSSKIVLTASNDDKTSFHVIFPGVVMKDVANAGAVARKMISEIWNEEMEGWASKIKPTPTYGTPLLFPTLVGIGI